MAKIIENIGTESSSSLTADFRINPDLLPNDMTASVKPLGNVTGQAVAGTTVKQYFPTRKDKVIRVGESLSINWYSNDISDVNIYFVKNNQPMFLGKFESSDGRNTQEFTVDNTMFSEEYFDCYVMIENKDDKTINTRTTNFKVMRQL